MASPYQHLQWQTSYAAPVERLPQKRVRSQQAKQLSAPQVLLRVAVVLALLFGVLQAGRTMATGAYKMAALFNNQIAVQQSLAEAREENAILTEKIDVYSSSAGIEEMARNSLQMVGQNEVLVRIH